MQTRITARLFGALTLVALAACTPYEEPLPRRDRLHFPIGMAMHKSGNYLYVVNSNFDARYSADLGGTVSVIDIAQREILATSSPYIPSFGGFIKLNEDNTKAYVTARRNNSLVAFDVSPGGGALSCQASGTQESGGRGTSNPTGCLLTEVPPTGDEQTPIPNDPFGLGVFTVDGPTGTKVDVVSMAHLRGTFVSSVTIPWDATTPTLGEDNASYGVSAATMQSASMVNASNVVTQRPGTREMYVGGRNDNRIVVFTPFLNADTGEVEALLFRRAIDLNHATEVVDVRGITFEPDGSRMYVVTQIPDALHIFDVRPENPETGTGVRHDLAAVVPLPNDPSDVVLHRTPGTDARVLYIPCYDDQSIQIVDPVAGVILDQIELDARPYQMVVDTAPDRCQFQPNGQFEEQFCNAYVTLFADTTNTNQLCEDATNGCGSVAVIDLDPSSDRYHTVISKIR